MSLTSFNPLSPDGRKSETVQRGSFFSRLFKGADAAPSVERDSGDGVHQRGRAASPVTVPQRRLSPGSSSDEWSVASTPPLHVGDGVDPPAHFAPSSLPDRQAAGPHRVAQPPAVRALFAASRSTSAPDLAPRTKSETEDANVNMGSGTFGEGLGEAAGRAREDSSVVDPAGAPGPGAAGGPLDFRSMTVVLKRLRNIADPQQDGQFQRHYWMPDQNCKECYDCGAPFHTFRRRHHCRLCGQIFCWKCCGQVISGEMFGHRGDLRVCNHCHRVIEQYKETEGRDDPLQASKKSTPSMSPSASAKFLARSSSGPLKSAAQRSQGGAPPPPADGREPAVRFAEDWPAGVGIGSPHHAPPDEDPSESDGEDGPPLTPAVDASSMLDDDDAGGPAWLRQVSHGWTGGAVGAETAAAEAAGDGRAARDMAPTVMTAAVSVAAASVTGPGAGAVSMPMPVRESAGGASASAPLGSVAESQRSGGSMSVSSEDHDRRYSFNSFKRPRQEFLPRDRYESYIKNAMRGEDGSLAEALEEAAAPTDAAQPAVAAEPKERKASVDRAERDRLAHQRLTSVGAEHVAGIMRQLLRAEGLDPAWEEVLLPLVDRVTGEVRPDVRSGDKMDVREYVKVKRIAGGTMSQSAHVRGVVCTKNVAHKRMCRDIAKPRILMLRFAVEYQRADKQLSSLDPLVLQEKDHLKILVAKIASARPDIVLVEKTVSRLAQDYMLDAGIVLALNVKASVMERVSRCTGADILTSVDKLNFEPRLGTCAAFRLVSHKDDVEHTQQLLDDDRPAKPRTLMHFEGCPVHLGCTITLRGATRSVLARVKRVVKFAVYVAHSLRLETRLLMDESAMLPDGAEGRALAPIAECEVAEECRAAAAAAAASGAQCDEWLKGYFVPSAEDFCGAILSGSPCVRFPLPFLYTKDGHRCPTRALLPAQAYWTRCAQDVAPADEARPSPAAPRESVPLGGDTLVPARANAVVDCLSPHNHQSITVLFSSLCPGAANPCIAPQVVRLKYFMDNDMTLGQYLERFCFSPGYRCPHPECEQPMVSHVRSYTHDNARINIAMETFQTPVEGSAGVIFMWSWCKVCHVMTPVVPMSDEAWGLSFAKYLELSFYGASYISRSGSCPHSLHRDHVRYFGRHNLAVQLEYDTIDLLEIAIPPAVIEVVRPWCPDWDAEIRMLEGTAERVFEAVREKVSTGPDMDVLEPQRADACREQLRDVGAQADRERAQFVEGLRQARVLAADACGDTPVAPVAGAQLAEHLTALKRTLCMVVAGKNTALGDIWHAYAPEKGRRTASSKSAQLPAPSPSPMAPSPSPRMSRTLDYEGSSDSLPSHAAEPTPPPPSASPDDDNGEGAQELDAVAALAAEATMAASAGGRASMHLALPHASAQPRPNEKRGAIMKFLTGGTAPGYQPLSTPFAAEEHYLLPPGLRSLRAVYEDEPSSIVAYTLASREYHEQMGLLQAGHRAQGSAAAEGQAPADDPAADTHSAVASVALDSIAEEAAEDDAGARSRSTSQAFISVGAPPRQGAPAPGGAHIKHQFSDSTCKFYCKVYFAEQFRWLRGRYVQGGEAAFVQSLSRCISWAAHGGKSGSSFCKTRDDRYIVKQMSRLEAQSFMEFAEHYFDYMWKDYNGQRPTVMAKILGVYRIGFKNSQTGRSLKQDVLVMENLFYMRRISRIFDLKGSIRSRYVQATGRENDVLMDENLLEFICESPIFIRPHTKTVLKRSIWNDTSFLSRLNVMDYSLLVGIDEQRSELVIGIIDYIRTFTWDKKLEMWVKSTGILGGHGKMPTVVSPEVYKVRFREAMDRYFLMVPDKWTGLGLDSIC